MLEAIRKETPEEGLPRPDIKNLRDALQGAFGIRSFALSGLFLLACFYTLYFGRAFFLPIILSLLLNFLLSPVVRGLKKIHIPEALGAGLVILGLLGLLGLGIFELAAPAYDWVGQAPQSLRKVESRIRDLKKPVQTMSKATEQVEKITKVAGGPKTQQVQVTTESLGSRVLSRATDFVADAVVMFILLYFLLASGDLFLRKLIKVLPSRADKQRAIEIARQIETEVSTYLATITVINVVMGLLVWGAMALIGVPNPLLWGVLATFANYIPYLGAITMVAVLSMVGLLTFPDLPRALIPPGAFLGLTFWGWMWGITGAILAVPIMMVFKILCEHSEPLSPVGEFLGS